MYLLSTLTRVTLRVLAGIAAVALIGIGCFVAAHSPAAAPDEYPAVPLPPITAPLDPASPVPDPTAIPPSK